MARITDLLRRMRAARARRGAWPASSRTRLALLGLAVFACAGPPATVVPADSEITLAPGERAQVAGSDFVITFEKVVRDDRCPVGVFCIHFGDALVAFRAERAGTDTTVVLSTADTTAPAAIGPYRLELDALAPFKQQETAIPATAYRATVKVSRSDSLPAGRAP
jgi:hypothetical protein